MKRGTPDHPKTKHLARLLGIPKYAAVGLLECLWQFAQRYTPAGNVGKYDDAAIAMEVEWTGDAAVLIDALRTARWIDDAESPADRLVIHDWEDHCDRSVSKYLSGHKLNFARRRDSEPLQCAQVRTNASEVRTGAHKSALTEPEPVARQSHSQSHSQSQSQLATPEPAAQPTGPRRVRMEAVERNIKAVVCEKALMGTALPLLLACGLKEKDAAEVLRHPNASPEKIDWAIETLKTAIAKAKKGGDPVRNPPGYVRDLIVYKDPPAGWIENRRRKALAAIAKPQTPDAA